MAWFCQLILEICDAIIYKAGRTCQELTNEWWIQQFYLFGVGRGNMKYDFLLDCMLSADDKMETEIKYTWKMINCFMLELILTSLLQAVEVLFSLLANFIKNINSSFSSDCWHKYNQNIAQILRLLWSQKLLSLWALIGLQQLWYN